MLSLFSQQLMGVPQRMQFGSLADLIQPRMGLDPMATAAVQPMVQPTPRRAFSLDNFRTNIRDVLSPEIGLKVGAAMMSGKDFGDSMARGIDTAGTGIASKRERNKTLEYLSKNNPELAAMVAAGMPINEAWDAALKKSKFGTETPSTVREWEYFNGLSKEDQARYLRMKRSNPYLDIGTGFVQPDPTNPGQVSGGPIIKENYQEGFDTARGTEAGKTAAEMPRMKSKAQSTITALETQNGVVKTNITKALAAIRSNPGMVTGLGGKLTNAIPGTPAYDLARTLETIKANIGFDKLQSMRENSPTGGALGQVSDFENRQLQAIFGNLEQAQSDEQLLENLMLLQAVLEQMRQTRRDAFQRDFGDVAPEGQPLMPPAPSGGGQRLRFNPATGELE